MDAIAAFLLCTIVGFAAAYPTGAPVETCKTFTANHSGHAAQTSKSKYEILPVPTSVKSGDKISVIIQGVGDKFKGFFIQGQDQRGRPIGKFLAHSEAQTRDCAQPGSADSATHVNKSDKQKITLQWQAPAAYKGKVVFRAVIVKNYEVFWNNLFSAPLTVV